MSSTEHQAPCSGFPEAVGDSFFLTGPLPSLGPDERSDYFVESKDANDQYVGHRSMRASIDTRTYHVLDQAGSVAGFISFKIASEEGRATTRIFTSVEYIYVMQKFRMRGLARLLLEPLLQDVHVALRKATGPGRKLRVRIYSSSHPESFGGNRTLRALEERLFELSKRYRRVDLIGRHFGRPTFTPQRPWEHSQATVEVSVGS